MELRSKRLRYINASPQILQKILDGNEALAAYLHIRVPEYWTEFGEGPFRYVLNKLETDPEEQPWWSYLPVLLEDHLLIGNAGYKGPPVDGVVEIGYEVIPSHRGIGLATEIAACMVDNALSFPEVTTVMAHTLPEENASCKVLRKCGFEFSGIVEDPEDGTIWRWVLKGGI